METDNMAAISVGFQEKWAQLQWWQIQMAFSFLFQD